MALASFFCCLIPRQKSCYLLVNSLEIISNLPTFVRGRGQRIFLTPSKAARMDAIFAKAFPIVEMRNVS